MRGGPARSIWVALVLLCGNAVTAAARVVCATGEAAPPARLEPRGSYVVAVSAPTYALPEWRGVVDALRRKYAANVAVYPAGKPQESLPELRRLFPRYVCFVGRPEECGRDFVVAVSRLTRRLDEDPYGDVLWGIVTGYEAADAMRIARLDEPLVIRRGATSMGPGLLQRLESGFASNEDSVTDFWTKEGGTTSVVHTAVRPDAARALAEAFNARQPEVFYTSGHATERDWQIAYNKPGGAFRCENGNLFAQSTDGSRYPISSPNAKVYLPVGNCLIGHLSGRDSMAAAWLHSGGIGQMIGYTVVTFYGYMGWGTGMLFEEGRLSLAESFFLNNQALLHQLATRYPDLLAAMPETYDAKDVRNVSERYAKGDRDALGLLWDRDTVAFYGDPAWVAHYPEAPPAITYRLEEEGGAWTLCITVLKEGGYSDPKWGWRPLMVLLPERVTDIRDVSCDRPATPVITDCFALVPLPRGSMRGEKVTVTFKARVENAQVK